MFKSGFVSIIGKPNSGKSTLINRLVAEKIAITSPKMQTTRDEIHGVYNDAESQIVFVDTPGIHIPHHLLGEKMNKTSFRATKEVELILYLVDGTSKMNSDSEIIIEHLKRIKTPIFLLITKIDKLRKDEVFKLIDEYKSLLEFQEIIPISSIKNYNIETLITEIKKILPEGPKFYGDSEISNRGKDFLIKELIRESIIYLTQEEIPHSIAVVIEKMNNREKTLAIDALIVVERDSQKKIIIGKQGSMIKEIGIWSRKNIEDLVKKKVDLNLFVRVEKSWRNKEKYLSSLGYEEK